MEMADLIVVTKADGDLMPAARRAQLEYTSALKFMHPKCDFWRPKVRPCGLAARRIARAHGQAHFLPGLLWTGRERFCGFAKRHADAVGASHAVLRCRQGTHGTLLVQAPLRGRSSPPQSRVPRGRKAHRRTAHWRSCVARSAAPGCGVWPATRSWPSTFDGMGTMHSAAARRTNGALLHFVRRPMTVRQAGSGTVGAGREEPAGRPRAAGV